MILDGYTWTARIGSVVVAYRPALRDERRCLLNMYRSMGESALWGWLEYRLMGCANEMDAIRAARNEYFNDPETIAGRLLGIDDPGTDSPWTRGWEQATAKNLAEGVDLELRHPVFARRDCGNCKTWWFNDETGQVVQDSSGRPLLRPKGTVTLCQTHSGCPKGTPENPKSLSQVNRQAYRHYRRCEATGHFPDDAIVARNAAIIRSAILKARKAG